MKRSVELCQAKGTGSGILRALKAYPGIEFINDTEAEQFKVIIRRPELERRGGEA